MDTEHPSAIPVSVVTLPGQADEEPVAIRPSHSARSLASSMADEEEAELVAARNKFTKLAFRSSSHSADASAAQSAASTARSGFDDDEINNLEAAHAGTEHKVLSIEQLLFTQRSKELGIAGAILSVVSLANLVFEIEQCLEHVGSLVATSVILDVLWLVASLVMLLFGLIIFPRASPDSALYRHSQAISTGLWIANLVYTLPMYAAILPQQAKYRGLTTHNTWKYYLQPLVLTYGGLAWKRGLIM